MTINPRPGSVTGLRVLASIAVLSLALGGCGAAASPTPGSTSAAAPSLPPVSSSTLPSASPSPSPSVAAAPSTVAAIPDGAWLSDPIPVATVRSMIEQTHLSAADKQSLLTEAFGVTATSKVINERLVLDQGNWVQLGSWDGAPMTDGSKGSFAFPDATTIAMQDNVSLITYRVALTGSTLRLTMLADSGWTGDLGDDVAPRIVFCTVAWHRQG